MSKVAILLILISVFFFACTNSGAKKDAVYIRIKNQTGQEITKLWLGNIASKSGSFSSVSYQTTFKNIKSNSVSKYQQTRGKFWGYHRGNFLMDNGQQGFLQPNDLAAAVRSSGIRLVDATMESSVQEKKVTKPTLPEGKYTFVIKPKGGNSSDFRVEILKD